MLKSDKLKEGFYEATIWIVVFTIGFVSLIVTLMTFATEMDYKFNGVKTVAVYDEIYGAQITTKTGEVIYVTVDKFMKNDFENEIVMYYFEDNPREAIILSAWQWWAVTFILFGFMIIISIIKIYKIFKSEKMLRTKFDYEKKEVSSEELAKILGENFAFHNKDLYEKHLDSIKFDSLKYTKVYSECEADAKRIIEEQEKIWQIGTVYIGAFPGSDVLTNTVRKLAYTDLPKYINNPMEFYDIVKQMDEKNPISEDKNIHIADTMIDTNVLPFAGRKNKLYLVVGKPSLCENVVLMPEWYYFREEIEVM